MPQCPVLQKRASREVCRGSEQDTVTLGRCFLSVYLELGSSCRQSKAGRLQLFLVMEGRIPPGQHMLGPGSELSQCYPGETNGYAPSSPVPSWLCVHMCPCVPTRVYTTPVSVHAPLCICTCVCCCVSTHTSIEHVHTFAYTCTWTAVCTCVYHMHLCECTCMLMSMHTPLCI